MKKIGYWLLVIIWLLYLGYWSFTYAQAIAPDPTRLSVGGRILGMGKAFVGLTDDLGALYTNPAGLGAIERWQLTSMSGTFMEDFNYLNLSGAYPTNLGVFAFGFTNSSIAGGYATRVKEGSDPLDPVYEVDTSQAPISYYNNVFLASYGNKLENLRLPFKLPFETLFGTNLKLFYAGLTGGGAGAGLANATAQGMDLDFGLLFKFTPWFWAGTTVQNVLPASLGGKLRYGTGHEESYPAIFENGITLRLLGEENALRKIGSHDLKLLFDTDYYPTRRGFPVLLHYGLEWLPMKLLAIRAGIDQDAAGDGTGTSLTAVSNLTAGVGLYLGGFRFDYAYHQFAGAPGITNNFFSLSYGIVPAAKKLAVKIEVAEPKDKSLVFDEKVKIAGKVLDPEIRALKTNGNPVRFGLRGEFETIVDLPIGKNKAVLIGLNEMGKEAAVEKVRLLRLSAFPDVLSDYWAREPISVIAMAGIVGGYPDGTFKPEGNITRAEMCALLMKTITTTAEPAPLNFNDVLENHWAAGFIARAAKEGVVKGYDDGTFKPNGLITRAEGLSMITRLAKISEEVAVKFTLPFPDIDSKHWAAKIISGAAKAGLLEFIKDKPFSPSQRLTRSEAVEILYRTGYIRDILKKDLLNWEKY